MQQRRIIFEGQVAQAVESRIPALQGHGAPEAVRSLSQRNHAIAAEVLADTALQLCLG